MKKLTSHKIFSLLLCAAALLSLCAVPAAAAGSDPKVISYSTGSAVIQKGNNVAITVTVKDADILTSTITDDPEKTENIDIKHLVDSFSTGVISDLEITSQLTDPLVFKFTVSAVYSGTGKDLSFKLEYKNLTEPYKTLTVPVLECVEYVAPTPTPTPEYEPSEPYVIPQPMIIIDRGDMDTVKPDEEFTLTVTIQNTEKYYTVNNPVVTFKPSSAFIILDSTPTKTLDTIKRGDTVPVRIRLKALQQIESPAQSVDVTVDFSYNSGDAGMAKGTVTQTVIIPVQTSEPGVKPETGAPHAVITRGDISTVYANQSFTLNVSIKNIGKSTMEAPVLSVSPDSSLAMIDPTMSRLLDNIEPGASVAVPIRLRSRDQLTSPSLSVALELKYSYPGGKDTAAETVFIPAMPNAKEEDTPTHIEGATPNVIISQYSYGDDPQVAAGSNFDLSMEFRNTSSIFTVENIVMTIGTGEGLTISSSSNTMFYASLRAGDTQDQVIGITVLPTAKTGSASIDVNFSYEYVDDQRRCKVNTTQSIAIPVYQPDRFEVELPALPEFVSAYEEMYISLPYVNKGKSEICNVRAELVSPDGAVSAINGVQNLGNFGSGSSGTIDFIFTPQMSGQVDFSFAITYEDPNAQEKTVEFPVSLMVDEPYYPEYDPSWDEPVWDEPVEENAGIPWWVWVIAGVVVAAAAVFIIVKVSKKKKKNGADLDSFVWEPESVGKDEVGTGGRE